MVDMRAKMYVTMVTKDISRENGNEVLHMHAVSKSTAYPADGYDENNTYAKFSPSGSVQLTIANPALFGKFKAGDQYYIDFTKA